MRIENCWFCSTRIYPGHGVTFVRNDSKVFKFCRSKCHKNFKMKRNPRHVRWSKAYRKTVGKELEEDSLIKIKEMKNRTRKYDLEKTKKTLEALQIINEIHRGRKNRFYEARCHKIYKKCLPLDEYKKRNKFTTSQSK